MAGHAGRGGQVVVVIDVAVQANARWIGVRIGQREAGAGVVEFGVQPGIGAVALLAIRGKAGGHVIRVGGALKFFGVAGIALRRKPLELSCGGARVARFAVHSRMRAD